MKTIKMSAGEAVIRFLDNQYVSFDGKEEKFVEGWVNSMKEADEIYVLDTGSGDNTVSKLKELGVTSLLKMSNKLILVIEENAAKIEEIIKK